MGTARLGPRPWSLRHGGWLDKHKKSRRNPAPRPCAANSPFFNGLLASWLAANNVPSAGIGHLLLALLVIFAATGLAWIVARRLLVPLVLRGVHKTQTSWDNAFAEHHFFHRLGALLPIVVFYTTADLLLTPGSSTGELLRRLAMALFVVGGLRVFDAMLLGLYDVCRTTRLFEGKPIKGYFGGLKLVAYILAFIFIVAIVTGQSPWGILSVLGGLTAVLLLVFKDTILGFVASIQLSALDMVRIGDWIEMPKYGADGDVIDVSIHTIKVQNWDKTITTIPTYALVSEAFKNWRGMQLSGGRRIKRAIFIDMRSIRFADDDLLARLSKILLLRDYIAARQQEIEEHNQRLGIDPSVEVNGRRQTNLGIFRAYLERYLANHPMINREMTFLVRHLPPGPQGLPMEIYVFCKDKRWANYESIQADIFDHILAALPHFDLRVFQYPSGFDLRER